MEITESILKSLSTPESFSRGYELYQSGAIFDAYRLGNTISGKCEGSSAPFYEQNVELDEGGVRSAFCTCPYEWGGYCKHLIALLLTCIHEPDQIAERKNVAELVSGLDQPSLISLIKKMVEQHPDLYPWLEAAASAPAISEPQPSRPGRHPTRVTKREYQLQIRGILHSLRGYRASEAYWMVSGMVRQLDQVRDTAYDFLAAGDAEGALILLTTLLEEVFGSYDEFDDSDGSIGGFLDSLAMPIVESILSAELDEAERRQMDRELRPLIREVSSYGIDNLDVILEALKPERVDESDDEFDEDGFDESLLVKARLNVLDRQGRVEEYLQVCLETGEYRRYVLKQIELGAFERATEMALKQITQVEDALAVAKAMRDAGHLPEALQIGEKGLALEGSKSALGAWLGPIEEAQGRRELALQAYQASYNSLPSLELYRAVQNLAGTGWEQLKPALMQTLRDSPHIDVLVDVYLSEEAWDEAIKVAVKAGDWNYPLMEKVADAVLTFRPDWVIQASRKQAEELIARTQSKYYAAAARWLAKMKQAYLASGRKSEWQTYLNELKSTYSRRPALQAELRKL